MSLINFAVQHNLTSEEAKARLRRAIEEVQTRYGPLIRKVEWSPGRDSVKLTATGVFAEMRVDPQQIHASIDIPVLGGLLGGSMAGTLKEVVQRQLDGP
jgi:hypothetical protein